MGRVADVSSPDSLRLLSMAARKMAIISTFRDRPVLSLYGLMIISLVALLPLPPLLQNQSYHQFADQRELFGIPNFWNVVSMSASGVR